jgi:hypothetical protein
VVSSQLRGLSIPLFQGGYDLILDYANVFRTGLVALIGNELFDLALG